MTDSASNRADSLYPIRPVGPDEFDRFHLVDQHAFYGSPLSESDRRAVLDRFEFDRSLAAFDGTASIDTGPVGTALAYSFLLSVPGGDMLPAAGVSWVSVLPTYRRRGVLRSLMHRQLADVRDHREPLAVLWASESAIYSRYGYGRASWYLSFTIKRGEGALARPASPGSGPAGGGPAGGGPAGGGLRLRITEPPAALGALAKVYDGVLQTRPGLFARNQAWWQSAIYDAADDRQGASPLRCLLAEDDSGPRGYALYSGVDRWDEFLPENVLTVRELMAADPAASASLWGDLLSRDLTSEFRIQRRPVDDPLLYQLADPRRTRPQLNDGLWVRIIDVPRALAGRRYSGPVDVVIEVRDDILLSNAGRWRLTAAGSAHAAQCVPAPGDAAADVALDVTELGAAYLGGTRLAALAAAGLVSELRPGAVRQLSAAMSWDPAPWCPMVF
jgi:predicted acetyltransferase